MQNIVNEGIFFHFVALTFGQIYQKFFFRPKMCRQSKSTYIPMHSNLLSKVKVHQRYKWTMCINNASGSFRLFRKLSESDNWTECNDNVNEMKAKFFYLNLIAPSVVNTFNLVSYTLCGTVQTLIFIYFLNEKSFNSKFSVIHTQWLWQ